ELLTMLISKNKMADQSGGEKLETSVKCYFAVKAAAYGECSLAEKCIFVHMYILDKVENKNLSIDNFGRHPVVYLFNTAMVDFSPGFIYLKSSSTCHLIFRYEHR
ncbi:hypothetical protein ACFLZT_00005, partial [Thermodesulfobacteriota bacterium]